MTTSPTLLDADFELRRKDAMLAEAFERIGFLESVIAEKDRELSVLRAKVRLLEEYQWLCADAADMLQPFEHCDCCDEGPPSELNVCDRHDWQRRFDELWAGKP